MIHALKLAAVMAAALTILYLAVGPDGALWTRTAAWLGVGAVGLGLLTMHAPPRGDDGQEG